MAYFKLRTNNSKKFYIQLNQEQKETKNTIMHEQVVVVTARAGCGKTATTVMSALDLLFRGEIDKIYISRPLETIGKDMGYLPGDMEDKTEPYMEVIKKAMIDVYAGPNNPDKAAAVLNRIEKGDIEILPIQFLRGHTIGDKELLIVTESQNLTTHEMEAILTRLGTGGRIVIEGDNRQKDIRSKETGLHLAIELSQNIEGIKHHVLVENHRSGIVREVIDYMADRVVGTDVDNNN